MKDLPHRQQLAADVFERLDEFYGAPPARLVQDPLAELVQTILSQNTADVNSDRAYAALIERYRGDWEAVQEAPTPELADTIRRGGLAEIKARRIQTVLGQIRERRGRLDLGFLREAPLDEGRAFLRSLDGVGPKTAACVLLFACGQPAMPVDTHVYRVSRRLGFFPESTTAEQAHGLLETLVPDEFTYAFHVHLIRHGRALCKAQRPRCLECPLQSLCAYAGRP